MSLLMCLSYCLDFIFHCSNIANHPIKNLRRISRELWQKKETSSACVALITMIFPLITRINFNWVLYPKIMISNSKNNFWYIVIFIFTRDNYSYSTWLIITFTLYAKTSALCHFLSTTENAFDQTIYDLPDQIVETLWRSSEPEQFPGNIEIHAIPNLVFPLKL